MWMAPLQILVELKKTHKGRTDPFLSCLIHAASWANAPRWGEGRSSPTAPVCAPTDPKIRNQIDKLVVFLIEMAHEQQWLFGAAPCAGVGLPRRKTPPSLSVGCCRRRPCVFRYTFSNSKLRLKTGKRGGGVRGEGREQCLVDQSVKGRPQPSSALTPSTWHAQAHNPGAMSARKHQLCIGLDQTVLGG
jgi:hypothetical protein